MIPKFRAWLKDEQEMQDVLAFDTRGHSFLGIEGVHVTVAGWCDVFEVGKQAELMQSTGLKDKNGVEIFEGEILHRKVHVILLGTDLNKWVNEYVHVEWKYGGWHVGEDLLEFVLEEGIDRHTGCTQTALEVIGNVYENPELLEVS